MEKDKALLEGIISDYFNSVSPTGASVPFHNH